MAKTWRCGDCGTEYPKTVHYCSRYFDDYLSLRGGSIESAITRAVEAAIAPLVRQAERRLAPRPQRVMAVRWIRMRP
jgi:hypothetical protein